MKAKKTKIHSFRIKNWLPKSQRLNVTMEVEEENPAI